MTDEWVRQAYSTIEQVNWTKEQYDAYIRASLLLIEEEAEQEESFKKGKEEGIAIGEARGEKKKTIAIAKSLLIKGVALQLISEASGLSLKELEELKCEKPMP